MGFSARNTLDACRLRLRAIRLVDTLERRGVRSGIRLQFRSRATAHRWSTAFGIVSGALEVGRLRGLADGSDSCGNLWFREDWAPGAHDQCKAAEFEAIVKNALRYLPPSAARAEEGFDVGDARRLPNLDDVPVSKHVFGLAVDLYVDWKLLGGEWSGPAAEVFDQFGLKRPYPDEPWHVELGGPASAPAKSGLTLLAVVRRLLAQVERSRRRFLKGCMARCGGVSFSILTYQRSPEIDEKVR